jgi:hypothetical protein
MAIAITVEPENASLAGKDGRLLASQGFGWAIVGFAG